MSAIHFGKTIPTPEDIMHYPQFEQGQKVIHVNFPEYGVGVVDEIAFDGFSDAVKPENHWFVRATWNINGYSKKMGFRACKLKIVESEDNK